MVVFTQILRTLAFNYKRSSTFAVQSVDIFNMRGISSFVVLVALSIFICLVEAKTNCDTLGINFYDNIGCARQNTAADCPSYNDCKYERQPGKCLYNGHILNDGESVESKAKDVSCNFGCLCTAPDNTKGTFTCAQGQCGFWGYPVGEECYLEYDLDGCCGKKRCEPSKASCEVDGKTYKEGEKFYPKDECTVCICTPEFNGKYEGPHCKRQVCAIEIRHAKDIENNCAPVYYQNKEENKLCCPQTFVCPSDEDTFKKSTDADSGLTCNYGTKTFKSDTSFTRTVEQYGKIRTITCECKLPPLFTCVGEL